MEECIKKIRNKNIAAGGYVAKNSEDMKWMIDIGMQVITYLVDAAVIYQEFDEICKNFKAITGKPKG